jgi:Tat protein translocase TatC
MWKFLLHKTFSMREKFAVDLGQKDVEKPFIEHLEDLRNMLVRIALTLLISTLGAFFFYSDLFEIIKRPLWTAGIVKTAEDMKGMLTSIDPTDAFMMIMNISLIAGVIVAFPILLLFILQFVLPGLKDNERKLIFPAIAIGGGLFLSGVLFSYFFVLPRALEFFAGFNSLLGVDSTWRVSGYVTFATRFILVFGISFELPVLVMALVKLDILNYKLMSSTRSHAIIGIAVFSAIITPTQDALTLLLMMGPLYVLYEICIWLAYSMEKKDRAAYPEYYAELEKDAAADKAAEQADWDNDDYNPWSTAGEDEDDDGATKPKSKSTATPALTDGEAKADNSTKEKSLEDYSDEDQKNRD